MEQSPDSYILNDNLFLTERSALSTEVLDSTLNAEQNVSSVNFGSPSSSSTFESSSMGFQIILL